MNRSRESNGRGHSSSLRPTIFIQRDNLLLSYDTIASSNGKKKKKIRWNRASRVWWQKMTLSLKDVRVHSLYFKDLFYFPFKEAIVSLDDNSKLSYWMKMFGHKNDNWPLPLLFLDLFIKVNGSRFKFSLILRRSYFFFTQDSIQYTNDHCCTLAPPTKAI